MGGAAGGPQGSVVSDARPQLPAQGRPQSKFASEVAHNLPCPPPGPATGVVSIRSRLNGLSPVTPTRTDVPGADASPDLQRGTPRFIDPALAALAREQGPLAAWHAAVERDATKAATGVRGAFGVGLVDRRGRSFLAVDRFSAGTMCYRVVGDRLWFDERADTLARAAPGRPAAEIDPQAIFDYLYFHVIPSPRTIFRGVFRLPPGHYALFERGRLTVEPYWLPEFQPAARGDFPALRDEFRHLLKQSVQRQLDGSKAACYLSGGTDSSTVAGMIREASGAPAASYSIGFEAEGYDEMAYARIAAQRFGTDHHEYYVTPQDLVDSIADVAGHYDQPFGNSSAAPAYYCAKMARADGVTRILAGDGGDELFGGNARYAKQRVFGWYGAVPRPLQRGLVEPLLLGSPLGKAPLLRKGASYVEQARVPMPARLQMYNLLLRLQPEQVLTAEFLRSVDTAAPLQHQEGVWRLPRASTELDRTLAFDWRYTLADSDLPKVCGSARMAGLDVGFPFLDEDLTDFSLKLPTEYKLKGLKLRWFFKEALRGFLPDEILTKKKHGFGLPFGVWATKHPGLSALARESLHSLARRGIVRSEFIATLLQTHLPAHPGYYGEMVWILMMLEQWMQRHARDTGRRDVHETAAFA